jgi:hypothetical protein
MTRLATVLALGALAAGGLLLVARSAGPSTAAPATVVAPGPPGGGSVSVGSSDTVHVEHEIVVVPHTPPATPPATRDPARQGRSAQARSALQASRSSRPQADEPSRGVAARAGRLLVGDGRYRPEPFPRVDDGQ